VTDGQNYDPQDCASIAASRGKNTQSLNTVNKEYKYNDQLIELIAVFVQHFNEKVSLVEFGCLVKQFSGVCSFH